MARLSLPRYDATHLRLLMITLGIWMVTAVVSGLLFWFGPPHLPLWSSLTQPDEQLAPSWGIVSIPLLSTFFLIVGLWYGRKTDLDHENYLAGLNWWAICLLQGLLLLALLRIAKVVL